MFLAPFNTMAARLDGQTIHSWGEIAWETDGPGGTNMRGGGKTQQGGMSSMAAKLEFMRFALIDEKEAAGAGILGQLQQNMAMAPSREPFSVAPEALKR